ncbi:MAG: Flp family type IVb pilin [Phreatobacter sp.]|jgi:pilus assembly protein Flp/PilA|uniref:Flp family type IVb pilin n=1 Tax=Phreatobacter sp. TaxID=1966341 RepID=UPI004035586B
MARRFRQMTRLAGRFGSDEAGATSIEYSLIASSIAGAVILAVYALGDTVQNTFFAKLVGAWQ